jgi:WD40 repeat protein
MPAVSEKRPRHVRTETPYSRALSIDPGARPRPVRALTLDVWARRLPWQALSLLGLAFAPGSCGFPAPEACALACGDEGACPDGFECQSESQLCVPRGRSAPCPLSEQFPAQPEPIRDAGTGGTGPGAIGGQGGAVGRAGAAGAEGGESGAAGSAGEGEGEGGDSSNPDTLAIVEVSGSERAACTGYELGLALRASGGLGPFRWRVTRAPAGVDLAEASGDEFELTGVPAESGSVLIELEDASGAIVHSEELLVYDSPEIVTQRLPAICSGEPYAMQLAARGGEPDEYVWSAAWVDAGDLPGTLDELGLVITGSTLSAELGASESLAPFQLALAVRDTHCEALPVEIELGVVPATSDECPTIGISNGPAIDALPPPCLGNVYSESLRVEGGEPPYAWRELSVPPGLTFDAPSATLHGVAQGNGVLAVELTDNGGRTIQKSYAVVARDKCWLAYVASEQSPARLELVDGRLLQRQPDAARRSFPDDASAGGVVDYEFSPDGRFIAYRIGPDASSLRLRLLRLSDGQEQEQDLGGSVTAYSWSSDASVLAVAFTTDNQTYLGGVDVSVIDRARAAPGGRLEGARVLDRRVVPSIDSILTSYDGERLAFLSGDPSASARRRLRTTARDAGGFAAASPPAPGDFSEAARLLAGAGGVFVAEPEISSLVFFSSDGGAPAAHAEGAVPSPASSLVGFARDGRLQIFRALESSAVSASPFLDASGCTTLLAWASARDRVACADVRDGRNQIAVFDVGPASSAGLAPLTPMPEPYLFPAGAHEGRPRALSASGSWFTFTSDAELYVSRLDARSARLWAELPTTALGTRPGALVFSPDERSLLIGAGNSLNLLDLERAQGSLVSLSSSAVINDACSERFADAADTWCGSSPRVSELAWSSGSDLVAFRSALGTLSVIDVSLVRLGILGTPLSPDGACSEACRSSQTARFQP